MIQPELFTPPKSIRKPRQWPRLTSSFILDALEASLGKRTSQKRIEKRVNNWDGTEYRFEVSGETGWAMFREMLTEQWNSSRIDLWAIAYWRGAQRGWHGCVRPHDGLAVAFEVKVSRSDFKREILLPSKRNAALRHSHCYYFAVPEGMVDADEVPEGCGLVYISEKGRIRRVIKPECRKIEVPSWYFVSLVGKRAECESLAQPGLDEQPTRVNVAMTEAAS